MDLPWGVQKPKEKVSTKILKVGRSDIDAITYKSMQNPKYIDGRDLFLVVWKGFLYTSFKGTLSHGENF